VNGGVILVAAAGVVVGGAVTIGANVVTVIGSSVALGRKKPNIGFGVASLIVGSLDTVGGSLLLGYGATNDFSLGFGVTFLALGVTNLTLGIANVAMRSPRAPAPAKASLYPIVGFDSSGHRMGGLGIRFVL
jgi:hypothetical protein